MYQFILIIHVFVAMCIIGLVLVQQGKGATIGASFGSGASQSVFGSRGSGSFLMRVTILFVVVFFATSISLNFIASRAAKQDTADVLMPESNNSNTVSPSSIPALAPVKK